MKNLLPFLGGSTTDGQLRSNSTGLLKGAGALCATPDLLGLKISGHPLRAEQGPTHSHHVSAFAHGRELDIDVEDEVTDRNITTTTTEHIHLESRGGDLLVSVEADSTTVKDHEVKMRDHIEARGVFNNTRMPEESKLAVALAPPAYGDLTVTQTFTLCDPATLGNGSSQYFTDRLRGVTLHYQVWGHGPQKILFVMGLATMGSGWLYQAEYFARHPEYQVCIYDNRGVGKSSTPPTRSTTSVMAEDAAALLDHLKWDRFRSVHVVGVSMGGMIAQELSLLVPDRVLSLCLLSTLAGTTLRDKVPPLTGLFKAVMCNLAYFHEDSYYEDAVMRLLYPSHALQADRQRLKEFHNRAMPSNYRPGIPGSVLQFLACMTHNLDAERLRRLRYLPFRKVVMTGDRDELVSSHNSTALADSLGADLVVFRGAGHAVPVERPEQFNEALHRHLNDSILHMQRFYSNPLM